MKKIQTIKELDKSYKAIFCDIWGVLHNGVEIYNEALDILRELKQKNVQIILITNSPRLNTDVARQLEQLNITTDFYDFIVTSGDSTRDLIKKSARKMFYIGPDNALDIINGLDVELVEDTEAQAILCTGLFDYYETNLTLYEDILLKAKSRNLPFICANPDIQVMYGEQLIYCAGALAKIYSTMGGNSLIAGKPHSAIYELAYSKLKGEIHKNEILAIGDGLLTDIKGAVNYDLDAIYVLNGVNKEQLVKSQNFDDNLVNDFVKQYNIFPLAYMDMLK